MSLLRRRSWNYIYVHYGPRFGFPKLFLWISPIRSFDSTAYCYWIYDSGVRFDRYTYSSQLDIVIGRLDTIWNNYQRVLRSIRPFFIHPIWARAETLTILTTLGSTSFNMNQHPPSIKIAPFSQVRRSAGRPFKAPLLDLKTPSTRQAVRRSTATDPDLKKTKVWLSKDTMI